MYCTVCLSSDMHALFTTSDLYIDSTLMSYLFLTDCLKYSFSHWNSAWILSVVNGLWPLGLVYIALYSLDSLKSSHIF